MASPRAAPAYEGAQLPTSQATGEGEARGCWSLLRASHLVEDYCFGRLSDPVEVIKACDFIKAHVLKHHLRGSTEADLSQSAMPANPRAPEPPSNFVHDLPPARQHGSRRGAFGAPGDAGFTAPLKRAATDSDNPHRNKVVSVRACLVCGGPRGTDDGSDGHCQSCYTALWRDAKRVVERGVRQKRSVVLTGDRQKDLDLFMREAASVGKACGSYNCPPEKYHHSISEAERCTRCRTKAAIRLLPDLSYRLLEKSCAAIIKDAHRKAALYGLYTPGLTQPATKGDASSDHEPSPGERRSRTSVPTQNVDDDGSPSTAIAQPSKMNVTISEAVLGYVPLSHPPVPPPLTRSLLPPGPNGLSASTMASTVAVSGPGGLPSHHPFGLMFNPYTGQQFGPAPGMFFHPAFHQGLPHSLAAMAAGSEMQGPPPLASLMPQSMTMPFGMHHQLLLQAHGQHPPAATMLFHPSAQGLAPAPAADPEGNDSSLPS